MVVQGKCCFHRAIDILKLPSPKLRFWTTGLMFFIFWTTWLMLRDFFSATAFVVLKTCEKPRLRHAYVKLRLKPLN